MKILWFTVYINSNLPWFLLWLYTLDSLSHSAIYFCLGKVILSTHFLSEPVNSGSVWTVLNFFEISRLTIFLIHTYAFQLAEQEHFEQLLKIVETIDVKEMIIDKRSLSIHDRWSFEQLQMFVGKFQWIVSKLLRKMWKTIFNS